MELVVTSPFGCSRPGVRHSDDGGMELHGSLAAPIPVPESPRYVAWEYEEIGRALPPYTACMQQLYEDRAANPRKVVDRIVVRDISGRHHVFYFDVSASRNAEREKLERAWKDREAGRPIDPEIEKEFQRAIRLQKRGFP